MKFEKLTPTNEVNLGIYEKAIDFVFSDDEIQNIAISGSYGAGKSSLLKSYKKKHAELEGKILNQLLHQIESNKIPRTNFKVKNTTESFDVTTITGCITFFY